MADDHISIEEEGAPQLQPDGQPQQDQAAAQLITVEVGWTAAEAANVVGGMVANLTLALYVMKYHEAPGLDLLPAIAGNPQQEFPLLGAGLVPILDMLAPKGSAAAVGISLSAGVGELVGAFARRATVLNTPPPARSRSATPTARAAGAPPPAGEPAEGGPFRFDNAAAEVLAATPTHSSYTDMGMGDAA